MMSSNHSAPSGNEVTVLVVDDDEYFQFVMTDSVLAGHGYHVLQAYNGWQCIEALAHQTVDVVVLDLNLPEGNGFRVLEDMRQQGDRAVTIVVSAYLDSQSRQRAFAAGAWEVVDKRFEDYWRLPQIIGKAMAERADRGRSVTSRRRTRGSLPARLELPAHEPYPGREMRTPERHAFGWLERSANLLMIRLTANARAAAARSAPVLIRGEPGSDRELLARYVHTHSKQSYGPFVTTGAMPGGALATPLGLTSADGLFSAARGGTLFIDQVHQLERDWQELLLGFLDRAAENMVGGINAPGPAPLAARLVVASTAAVDDRHWSALDTRLREAWSGSQLVIPPLRERPADVAGELEHLLIDTAARQGVLPPRSTPELAAALSRYQFPGNELELRAMVMLACSRKPGARLELHDLLPAEAMPRPRE
jgi:DNA-binding NtrC family response regulator